MYRLLLVASTCLAATHPELRGQDPSQADIDDGQCIPIKCAFEVPPQQCTRLCAQRHYIPVCQPPGDFCLCQRLVAGEVQLISPDEVLDQPLDQDYGILNVFAFIVPLGTLSKDGDKSEVGLLETSEPSPEAIPVNVHEGRLFWLFHYVLTGLFLLMVALIVYEVMACRSHSYEKYEVKCSADENWKTFCPA